MGSKEPIQILLLLKVVKISENWYNSFLSLYRVKSKAYKVRKIKGFSQMGDPWGDLNAPEDTSKQKLPLFSVTPDKKQWACQNNIFPKEL